MQTRLLAIILLVGFATRSECQEVDSKKLCELIRIPRPSLTVGITFNTEQGFVLLGERTENSAEIAALEKALCGDAKDAERYYLLSDLYDDEEKSKRAIAKATDLFKKQFQQDPRNGRLAMRLGQCLRDGYKDDDAEKSLREAVALAPKDAECWLALGDFLWIKCFDTLRGPDKKAESQMATLARIITTRTIPPEDLRKCSTFSKEAADCMDRAVAAAPRESKVYMARAMVRVFKLLLYECGRPNAEKDKVVDVMSRLLNQIAEAKVLADVHKAVELDPANPRAQVFSGACDLIPDLGVLLSKAKTADAAAQQAALKEFESQAIKAADKLGAKLDALANHQDKRIAAEACFFGGVLIVVKAKAASTDNGKLDAAAAAKAEGLLQRSVTLAPANELAWKLLIPALMVQEKKEKKLAAACEAWVRARDNAPSRYWAAYGLADLGRYAEAEKHLRAALAHNRNSSFIHAGLAAVLLRSGDPKRRIEAVEHLDKAEKLLQQDNNDDLAKDVAVLRAVHAALNGNPDTARQMLRALLKQYKHEVAEKMLNVLEIK